MTNVLALLLLPLLHAAHKGGLAPAYQPAGWGPPLVQVVGRQLLVKGEPFHIQGVCYSPVPIGENTAFPPFGDYFTKRFAYIWKRDLPLIKQMGATVVRIYGWDNDADHTDFLNEVHAHGLYALVTFYLGIAQQNPVATSDDRQKIITDFRDQVARYADHPGMLMWSFGNELNGAWNGFLGELNEAFGCGWNQGCVNNPWGSCALPVHCVYTALFTFIDNAAAAAKSVSTRPVVSGFADTDGFIGAEGWIDPGVDKIPVFEHLVPNLDAWGMQLYRGRSFGAYFANFAMESAKPLIVTEFGVDAYNDPCGWPENAHFTTCFNMWARTDFGGDVAQPGMPWRGCVDTTLDCFKWGVESQKEWDVDLAREIMAAYPENGGAVIGGFLMAWADEYWKGTSVQDHCNFPCPVEEADICRSLRIEEFLPGGAAQCNGRAHFTCDQFDTTYHDLCGYWLYSAPDHYVNEEWFGVSAPVPCGEKGPEGGYHLDTLHLRPVYYAMMELWGGWRPGEAVSPPLTCMQLKPCYNCLMKFLPKEITAGACDHICLSPGPMKSIQAGPGGWTSSGWWRDYFILVISSAILAALALVALLWCLFWRCRSKPQPLRPAGNEVGYGAL